MRKSSMLLAALSLVLTSNAVSAQTTRRDFRAPDIAVWIDRFSYSSGQRIRPFFQSDDGAFVTIVRVSTTGHGPSLYEFLLFCPSGSPRRWRRHWQRAKWPSQRLRSAAGDPLLPRVRTGAGALARMRMARPSRWSISNAPVLRTRSLSLPKP